MSNIDKVKQVFTVSEEIEKELNLAVQKAQASRMKGGKQ
jgi:hypothetical protein